MVSSCGVGRWVQAVEAWTRVFGAGCYAEIGALSPRLDPETSFIRREKGWDPGTSRNKIQREEGGGKETAQCSDYVAMDLQTGKPSKGACPISFKSAWLLNLRCFNALAAFYFPWLSSSLQIVRGQGWGTEAIPSARRALQEVRLWTHNS